jgi:hypothetical protein
MAEQEIDLPGKYSAIEEAVLIYLYEHPGWDAGTANLVQILKPDLQFDELQQSWEEVQYGIETLVKDGLVSGNRYVQNGLLQYSKLNLSRQGEVEAITQKRRPTKLVHDVPRPDRSKESSDKPE